MLALIIIRHYFIRVDYTTFANLGIKVKITPLILLNLLNNERKNSDYNNNLSQISQRLPTTDSIVKPIAENVSRRIQCIPLPLSFFPSRCTIHFPLLRKEWKSGGE
jgi:hypothetical protein